MIKIERLLAVLLLTGLPLASRAYSDSGEPGCWGLAMSDPDGNLCCNIVCKYYSGYIANFRYIRGGTTNEECDAIAKTYEETFSDEMTMPAKPPADLPEGSISWLIDHGVTIPPNPYLPASDE